MQLRPAIVLFGDSITQYAFGETNVQVGWASLLSSAYQRRADVLNRGFSGYNTRHALDLIPRLWGSPSRETEVLFTTIFFGANDAALPGERQHVPLEEYGENIKKLVNFIQKLQKKSSTKFPIIIITPPPVDDDAWKAQYNPEQYDRTNDITRRYGLEAKRIASETGCPVLDTWELLGGDTSDFGKHLCDGLHLSESGNKLVFEGLLELIESQFPDLAPQKYIDGAYQGSGMPVEEKLWDELC